MSGHLQSTGNQSSTVGAGSSTASRPAPNTKDWATSVVPLIQSPHSGDWIDDQYSRFRSYVPKSKPHASHHQGVQAEFCSALNGQDIKSLSELQTATDAISTQLSNKSTLVTVSELKFGDEEKALILTIQDNKSTPELWLKKSVKSAMRPLHDLQVHRARAAQYEATYGP
jgi:hypothetical protein